MQELYILEVGENGAGVIVLGWVREGMFSSDNSSHTHNANRAGWKLPLVVVLGNDVIANHTVECKEYIIP